ncbi:hypothetical protein [Pseudomonas sp. GZJR-8]|uniref:hypothetical protein n=1 Tax=Pseudomonas sp. GZJR-8 TaxID=1395925 RepID=UPI000CDA754E|nr:hypothetical protein [Pseudomonas sp. GZJR-8]
MKRRPQLSILKGLLFTYCIENTRNLEREEIIASKNINNPKELMELFDTLTKPVFYTYTPEEQDWFIETIRHYLLTDETFDSVFYLFDTYFEDDIIDNRAFMKTLLDCLTHYKAEATANE